jgi:cold shock CspA family protein
MTTKRNEEKKGKGRVRSLVRRGSKSDRGPAVARRTAGLRGPTMCERCGAVYRAKRWQRPAAGLLQWPVGLAWTVCPACKQVQEGEYFGRVLIQGGAAVRDEAAVRHRVERIAERAQWTQPQRRVISMERRGDDLEVLTTSQKLAHRIVRSLLSDFGGTAVYGWSDADGELRATWRWEEEAAPSAPAPARKAAATPGRVDLEIQSRHADVDPLWRNLIERNVEGWAERYPRLLRVHVTLQHGRHRHGSEQVALVANYPGFTLRVEKRGEAMEDAIHAACLALGRELRRAKETRRRITKTPGARPQGSVKRIFRDGGYGFILLDRGREAYFHRDSLHMLRFESLKPGTPVEVELEQGRDGLQASRVFPVGNRRGA